MTIPIGPRVFVVNEPRRRHDGSAIDISPAEEYGTLVFLLPPGSSLDHAATIVALERGLADFAPGDTLLPLGDMTACVIAASIVAARTDGSYAVLRWNDTIRRYARVEVDLARMEG